MHACRSTLEDPTYPPFGLWSGAALPSVREILGRAPAAPPDLGLYVHIPFCRRRCHFCYFKVYTERHADEVARYVDLVVREAAAFAPLPFVAGRRPRFIYFGGGTPSFLSATQLDHLFRGLRAAFPFDAAEEVTFECEPGTISEAKLRVLKDMGVTRLSIGVESFDDAVLERNNRAHLSRQVHQAYEAARRAGLPQVNLDLIAGMVGETDESWRAGVAATIALAPDSVTIYQMELPPNTTLSRELKARGIAEAPVASWPTKREWVGYAFAELERAGYRVSSAYTVVDGARDVRFRYRDCLWTGADLLGLGVSAFSHVGGAHFQNEKEIERYQAAVEAGELPLQRGFVLTDEQRLIRELILQLKLGTVGRPYFQSKFGVDLYQRFAAPLEELARAGQARLDEDRVVLSRPALLQVDALLSAFYLPEHRV